MESSSESGLVALALLGAGTQRTITIETVLMKTVSVEAVAECPRNVCSMAAAREQQQKLSRRSYCFGHHDQQPRAVRVLEGTGAVD